MSRGTWQEQSGAGKAVLKSLGEDVRKKKELFVLHNNLLDQANARGSTRASQLIDIWVQSAANKGWAWSNTDLVDELSETQANQLLRESRKLGMAKLLLAAAAGHGLADTITAIEKGGPLTRYPVRNSRFRLRVLEGGVVDYRRGLPFSALEHHDREPRPLEAGELFEGGLSSIQSAPAMGGELFGVEPFLRRAIFSGLVSPASGEPRVELELLTKTQGK